MVGAATWKPRLAFDSLLRGTSNKKSGLKMSVKCGVADDD
jgi:hypothetical protein